MQKLKFLEPGEVQRLMEAPNLRSQTGLRNRCILGLLYESGLRIGEALALKPRDVVIAEKRVQVLRGKGSKARTVYFRSDELALLLERWKQVRPTSDFLFCTIRNKNKGAQLSPRSFRFTFNKYVAEVGLPPWTTPHVLRHTMATEMMRRGVSLRVVQESLGHANISTTQIYTHVTDVDIRTAMRVDLPRSAHLDDSKMHMGLAETSENEAPGGV